MLQEENFILRNIGDSVGKLLLVTTPPDFEKFFKEVGIVVGERSSFKKPEITPADVEKVVEIASKYGLEIKI